MAWCYHHRFYTFFQVALVVVLLQWTIQSLNDSNRQSSITSSRIVYRVQQVTSRKFHKDIKSVSETSLSTVTLSSHSNAAPKWPSSSVKPEFMPIVIFSSFRVHYTTKLLNSLQVAAANVNLDTDSPCIFILHKNKNVLEKDVTGMEELLDNVQFCKVYKKVYGAQNQAKRTAAMFKAIWYNAIKGVFEDHNFANTGALYKGDVIFLEDDIVLSPDALKVFKYGMDQKKHYEGVLAVALGGWSGENVINAHPDTFVIRRSFYFPSMAYAFNVSTWNIIKSSNLLRHRNRDWSEALGDIVNKRLGWAPFYMVPTLGRIWHIGSHGLGLKGDSSMKRHVELRAHWTKAPRLINLHTAKINKGYRDLFGFYCGNFVKKSALCPRSYFRFPAGRRFDIICVDAGKGPEPCIRKYPYLERDFTNWIH